MPTLGPVWRCLHQKACPTRAGTPRTVYDAHAHSAEPVVEITIQWQMGGWTPGYEISAPSRNYYARKKMFFGSGKLNLMTGEDRIVAKLRSRFSPFRGRFNFDLPDGRIYDFRCVKAWKGVWACEGADERYQLYQHKGRRYSIFQDERQIAAYATEPILMRSREAFDILLNDDANAVVIICMVLAMDGLGANDRFRGATNIGPEDREFDERWGPS